MSPAKLGDTVRVHYTGRLDDGTEFDTSSGGDPLEFTIGKKEVIPGFESAVVGMSPGETKTEKVPAERAYGTHRKDRVFAMERGAFPPHLELAPGLMLQMTDTARGLAIRVTIVEVQGEQVTLDANHPLAGKDLTFEITLVSIA